MVKKRRVERDTVNLAEIDRRLWRVHRTAPLGNRRNPLDELVYIQLSVRTREGAYQSTFPALRRRLRGRWGAILEMPNRELIQVLRSGGMARVKAARLRGMMEAIRHRFGRVSLAALRGMTDRDAESFLRSLPGVGPKVARCILLYSLDRSVFPVDTHCRRVLTRLGCASPSLDIKKSHDTLQRIVPVELRRSLHVNLIHHGRRTCMPTNPRCTECVLADLCAARHRSTRSLGHIKGL